MSIAAGNLVVTTRQGQVRGQVTDGVAMFKGIPYAAPPFGSNRFQAPRPPEPWGGVRDALEYGRVPPQPPYAPPFDRLLGDQGVAGDDCLNLNVWTPDPSSRGLPVLAATLRQSRSLIGAACFYVLVIGLLVGLIFPALSALDLRSYISNGTVGYCSLNSTKLRAQDLRRP